MSCLFFYEKLYDDNKLLKYYDLHVKSFIFACKALGLINKFVTRPLWRLLEFDIHILDLNKYYQEMARLFDELFVNSSEVFFLYRNEHLYNKQKSNSHLVP